MKIISVSRAGVSHPKAEVVVSPRGKYYCLTHGEQGRGRWQLRLALGVRDFPVSDDSTGLILDREYRLIRLDKRDQDGQPMYLIGSGCQDGWYLVLLRLSPGFRGGASYAVEGQCEVLARGYEAQGQAGRMGGAECPLLLVTGPCRIRWSRFGRLYGTPSEWIATYDGKVWSVSPVDEDAIAEAALS